MSVSKTLRYQVLRRDNHTCRYCGGVAPDAILTVDHVLAVTLGGSDDPDNLVAACRDCNAGKAASVADQPLIDQVSEDAVRWAKAVEASSAQVLERHREILAERALFDSVWRTFTYKDRTGTHEVPRPSGWEDSVDRMQSRGLPTEILQECARIAMKRPKIEVKARWNYFCGIAWTKIRAIDTSAMVLYNEGRDSIVSVNRVCGETDCEPSEFPDMELMGYFSERLVDLMGGSPADHWFASRVLWDGIARASRSWSIVIAAPDGCRQKAMAIAREEVDASIALHLQKMVNVGKDPRSVYYMGAPPREPVINIGGRFEPGTGFPVILLVEYLLAEIIRVTGGTAQDLTLATAALQDGLAVAYESYLKELAEGNPPEIAKDSASDDFGTAIAYGVHYMGMDYGNPSKDLANPDDDPEIAEILKAYEDGAL